MAKIVKQMDTIDTLDTKDDLNRSMKTYPYSSNYPRNVKPKTSIKITKSCTTSFNLNK